MLADQMDKNLGGIATQVNENFVFHLKVFGSFAPVSVSALLIKLSLWSLFHTFTLYFISHLHHIMGWPAGKQLLI